MAPITNEELYLFHRMDREIFSRLVLKLARDPAQTLLVMALWLWLETFGYPNVIPQMINLPDIMIGAIAEEAVSCLTWLELENASTPNTPLPLTTALLQKHISLQLFSQKRFTAIAGIKHVLNNTCSRIFTDILQNIYCISSNNIFHHIPFIVPGFPHPLFGTFTIPPTNFEELDLSDPRIWENKKPSDDVSDDDKTMFLTFSRGFPVTEEEVRYVFTTTYGNIIKAIQMGNGDSNDQVLFATMILNNVEALDQILNGKSITKLRVNGKHIWARKYERRA